MRADTHARLTLLSSALLGLVPVRSWQRGEIDTATMALRLVVATAVVWAVLLVVRKVLAGYATDADPGDGGPRRRAEDRLRPAGTEG